MILLGRSFISRERLMVLLKELPKGTLVAAPALSTHGMSAAVPTPITVHAPDGEQIGYFDIARERVELIS